MSYFSAIGGALRSAMKTIVAALLIVQYSTSFANDHIDTLYGVDTVTDSLVTIDTNTGIGTVVGPIGFDEVVSLAFDPRTRTLYGVDFFSDQLLHIDTQTGAGTAIGVTGLDGVRALAFDTTSSILYGTDTSNATLDDDLVTIDTATGSGSRIGTIGLVSVGGLTYDATSDTLFAIDGNSTSLVDIDRATGDGTIVGPLGFPLGNVSSLAFDATTNTLYGIDHDQFDFSDDLVAINRSTGEASAVSSGPLGFRAVRSLAFAPAVPEPTTGILLVGAAPMLLSRRRRN